MYACIWFTYQKMIHLGSKNQAKDKVYIRTCMHTVNDKVMWEKFNKDFPQTMKVILVL